MTGLRGGGPKKYVRELKATNIPENFELALKPWSKWCWGSQNHALQAGYGLICILINFLSPFQVVSQFFKFLNLAD